MFLNSDIQAQIDKCVRIKNEVGFGPTLIREREILEAMLPEVDLSRINKTSRGQRSKHLKYLVFLLQTYTKVYGEDLAEIKTRNKTGVPFYVFRYTLFTKDKPYKMAKLGAPKIPGIDTPEEYLAHMASIKTDREKFAEGSRSARSYGISVNSLCRTVGVSTSTIYYWTAGHAKGGRIHDRNVKCSNKAKAWESRNDVLSALVKQARLVKSSIEAKAEYVRKVEELHDMGFSIRKIVEGTGISFPTFLNWRDQVKNR